jgi:hypothetical protein
MSDDLKSQIAKSKPLRAEEKHVPVEGFPASTGLPHRAVLILKIPRSPIRRRE